MSCCSQQHSELLLKNERHDITTYTYASMNAQYWNIKFPLAITSFFIDTTSICLPQNTFLASTKMYQMDEFMPTQLYKPPLKLHWDS